LFIGFLPLLTVNCIFSPYLKKIEVGVEGAALATSQTGAAAECLEKLGGLSLDQLRWMSSSLTETELVEEADGWDVNAVPYSDRNDVTRLWSELHRECEPVEIAILGPAFGRPSYNFFTDVIFKALGETMSPFRYFGTNGTEELVSSMQDKENALAFFNIRYVLSEADKSVIESLQTVALRKGHMGSDFVDPSFALFDDGNYAFAKRLYMNLNQEETSLANVRPFLEYAFSEQGTNDLLNAGFWPIHEWERVVMKTRAQTTTGIPLGDIQKNCGPTGGNISIAGSSTVFPVAQICTFFNSIFSELSYTRASTHFFSSNVCAKRQGPRSTKSGAT
jgi:ABC-type phosphate transport system substrate-binding protein